MKSKSWRFCKKHFEEGRRTPTKCLPNKPDPVYRKTNNSKRRFEDPDKENSGLPTEPATTRVVFNGLVSIYVN